MIRRLLAALIVVASLVLAVPPANAVTPVLRPSAEHPVVVVGVDGLTWDQIGPRVQALDDLARTSSTGLLAGRGADEATSTLDAWATLSAGNRARAHDLPDRDASYPARDPGVAVAQRQTSPARTGARVGALADGLAPDCVSTNGGRGPDLAAASSSGEARTGLDCPVVLLDARDAAAADSLVRRWRPRALLLIVVGLGDGEDGRSLNVAMAAGDGFSGGQLISGSTRRVPYVQLVDVAPTILAAMGRPVPPSMIGEPWRVGNPAPADLDEYLQANQRARFMPTAVVGVVIPLVVVFVLALGAAALLRWRGRARLAWRVALWDCRIVAAAPAATFLARVFPYDTWGLLGLWPLILALDAAILLLCRGRVAFVGVFTAVVLALDVLLDAPLQLHSVLGYSALVAGRFAGLGNPAFGAFAAAVLVTAMWVGGALGGVPAEWDRRRRVLAIVAVGVGAVIIDGAPLFGSDVGGVLALVPAFGLLALSVAGRRIRVRTVLLAGLAAVGVLVLFALADLARAPESRTHLGRFASDLLKGDAGETLSRKAAANWALLTKSVVYLIVPPLMVALAVVVARGERWAGTRALGRAMVARPGLRAGLVAALVAGTIGFAVNDSGVVVPAVMLLIVVPAAIEAASDFRSQPGEASGTGGVPLSPPTPADVP